MHHCLDSEAKQLCPSSRGQYTRSYRSKASLFTLGTRGCTPMLSNGPGRVRGWGPQAPHTYPRLEPQRNVRDVAQRRRRRFRRSSSTLINSRHRLLVPKISPIVTEILPRTGTTHRSGAATKTHRPDAVTRGIVRVSPLETGNGHLVEKGEVRSLSDGLGSKTQWLLSLGRIGFDAEDVSHATKYSDSAEAIHGRINQSFQINLDPSTADRPPGLAPSCLDS